VFSLAWGNLAYRCVELSANWRIGVLLFGW
jgi:hypothetical protein